MSAISTSEIDALTDALDATFSALSDPTRRAMLARLSQGEASVNELAAPFKMSLPAVSKHIKVLEKAGLLTKTRNAQLRPCKIDGAQLKQAVGWLEQYTTNNIAVEAINTPAKAKIVPKKQVNDEKQAQIPPKLLKPPKPAIKPKDKTNVNDDPHDPTDIQQQIGFDF